MKWASPHTHTQLQHLTHRVAHQRYIAFLPWTPNPSEANSLRAPCSYTTKAYHKPHKNSYWKFSMQAPEIYQWTNPNKLKIVTGSKCVEQLSIYPWNKLNYTSLGLQWCTGLEATLNAELVSRQQTTDIVHCLTPKRTPTQDNHPKQ